ncbi:S24/S26 family peptidase [Nocardioides panacisoli]|uniref:S24/S26 family peptidase n=1 Tax=Nocardioides panacisoli TaxID=627624 RepID=UPI001C628826|nr:S24/S26 family peptidase [Nocardioides panacisoli]QYJ05665.1 S24/S26 family peptidase [Nocardioides panacisoli]
MSGEATGGRRRLGLAVVSGASMLPTLRGGDRLLVRHGGNARPGRVVVARLPDGTVAVKRAVEERTTASGAAGWWLLSDNPDAGVDSRHRGPVADGDVLAVALARVWPAPRLL